METYEKYKPSGIDWIGEVPEHWELEKTKFIASLCTGNSLNAQQKTFYGEIPEDVDCRPYVASKDIDRDTEFIDYENGIRIPIEGCSFEIAPANSTLLCIEGGSAGKKMGFVDREVCYVNKLCCYNAFNINSKYLYYFIKSKSFWEVFSQNLQGMIGGVSVGVLKDIKLPIPTKDEQEAIAAYLDARCADIDKVVATQQKRIALLQELKQSEITQAVTRGLNPDARMKDSGVEWIGMVPEHWEVKKLKFVVSCNDDVLNDRTKDDQIIRYVEISDVNSIEGITNSTEYEFKKAPSRARRITKKDDVIVSTVRTYLKAIARIKEDDLIVSTGFAVLRAKNINPSFLAYSTLSELFLGTVISESVGVSYPAINSSDIINIKLPVPPSDEQVEIAEYLDRRCGEIDKQIGAVTKQIELLREYKQALITEVVTGKRKV